MTFSQHAATNRASKLFYSLLFITTLPILYLFFSAWFVPAKHLLSAFLWFAGISVLFQILCTLVPEEGGTKTTIHRILTGVSGVALLPLMLIMATSAHISVAGHITAWAMLCVMVFLLGIALRNQKGYHYALLLQISYYAAFFITILVSTYT